jgi:hypothetical protein
MSRGSNGKVKEWTDRIKRFQDSNLKVVEFCRNESVSQPSFYQWKRRLALSVRRGEPSGGPVKTTRSPVDGPAFKSMEFISTNVPVTSATTIRLPGGIEIQPGSDLRVTLAIVRQLMELPTGNQPNSERNAERNEGGRSC